jgi:hypothetical protein
MSLIPCNCELTLKKVGSGYLNDWNFSKMFVKKD